MGGQRDGQINAENFGFENTSSLVTTGIYHYIRHPMYSSLLLLTWGTLVKNITVLSLLLALVATGFLLVAARFEERENMAYFGDVYREYMTRSKKFLPGLY